MRLTYLVVLIATSAGGCATITSSELQPINVATYTSDGKTLDKARCKLHNDKGSWQVETPGYVDVHRSSADLTVECSKPGQPDGVARAISRAAASMYGNIVFGGVVGGLIDHTKGTGYDYPSLIAVRMGGAVVLDKRDDDGSMASLAPASVAAAPPAIAPAAPESSVTASAKSTASDPSLPATLPRPGDRWRYRYVDGYSNLERETFMYEVVAVAEGRVDDRMSASSGGFADLKSFTATGALGMVDRPLPKLQRAEFDPYFAVLRPDLGARYGQRIGGVSGQRMWDLSARVLGREAVVVPAGRFDAIKIEISGTRTLVSSQAEPVQLQHVIWYAPEAKRYVKYHINTWGPSGLPVNKDRFELLDFKLN